MRRFFWVGNHPGLDFGNTEVVDEDGKPVDLLDRPEAVWDWALQAELVSRSAADDAAACWREAGEELLSWARALRGVTRHLVSADGSDPVIEGRLARLVAEIPVTLTFTVDASGTRGAGLTAAAAGEEVRLAIAEAALAATGLDRSRIRICESDRCVLVYLDTSKNRSRRWCDMATCGNRAKAAAHYRRTRHRTT